METTLSDRLFEQAEGETDAAGELRYRRDGWVATITIDRPRALNSLTLRIFEEMQAALRRAERDDRVAVVVITGAGDTAFCAGADLKEHWRLCVRPREYVGWVREFIAMQTAIMRFSKPTIARINGLALGAGNELNSACDLAVMADDAVIRQAGPMVGSSPGIGVTQWVPLIIGDRRAREMAFLCEDVDADRALRWGLVNEVVPRDRLDAAVASLAARLTDKFPEALRITKTLLNAGKEAAWANNATLAGEWLALHSGSVETHTGMRAFLDKRSPDRLALRTRAVRDESPEFPHGVPIRRCEVCGTDTLPEHFEFCGRCGAALERGDDDGQ